MSEISRLKWRCRRGMKELDVLLERYLEQRYPDAPDDEQEQFKRLLELDDPDLYAMFVGRMAVPADLETVFARIAGTH